MTNAGTDGLQGASRVLVIGSGGSGKSISSPGGSGAFWTSK
ncbi:MAG: hypothetical protein ACR2GU_07335 [Rubrobacteraceae bacterium]